MTVPDPITRLEKYWAAILDKIQGGGSPVNVQDDKSVTITSNQNATVEPDDGYDAMSQVEIDVDVPNTYDSSDEGKVVYNGDLVEQTVNYEITEDDTYDTTTISSVVVNVGTPVEVEVITGTLADPFGGMYAASIATAIRAKNATVYLELDASAIGVATPLKLIGNPYNLSTLSFYAVYGVSANGTNCTEVAYLTSDNSLTEAVGLMGGQYMDVSAYATLVTSKLTYVTHPLPE